MSGSEDQPLGSREGAQYYNRYSKVKYSWIGFLIGRMMAESSWRVEGF